MPKASGGRSSGTLAINMKTNRDIKPFNELRGSTVEYFSEDASGTLLVESATHGNQKSNIWLTIDGTGSIPPDTKHKMKIMFAGTCYNAQVTIQSQIEDFCHLRLETMISDQDFWT